MTNFFNRNLGGGGERRPSSPAATTPGTGGRVDKGFGSLPSAARLAPVFGSPSERRDLGRTTGRAASPRSTPSVHRVSPGSPVVFGVFLLGPGNSELRKVLEEFAPYLDEATGSVLHWIVPGNPLASRAEFRGYLEATGVSMETLLAEWNAALARSESAEDVIADETACLAKAFGIGVSSMPAIAFVFPGQPASTRMTLPLGPGTCFNAQQARVLVDLLRQEFGAERLRAQMRSPDAAQSQPLVSALSAQIGGFLERSHEALPGVGGAAGSAKAAQKALAWTAIRAGATIVAGAKAAGISTQALYEDPTYGPLLRGISQQRRAEARLRPRGSKRNGQVEAVQEERESED